MKNKIYIYAAIILAIAAINMPVLSQLGAATATATARAESPTLPAEPRRSIIIEETLHDGSGYPITIFRDTESGKVYMSYNRTAPILLDRLAWK